MRVALLKEENPFFAILLRFFPLFIAQRLKEKVKIGRKSPFHTDLISTALRSFLINTINYLKSRLSDPLPSLRCFPSAINLFNFAQSFLCFKAPSGALLYFLFTFTSAGSYCFKRTFNLLAALRDHSIFHYLQ